MPVRSRPATSLGLASLTIMLAAACSAAPADTNANPAGGDYLAAAQAKVEQNYKGTNTMPDTTARKPTAGKKVVVISAGQSSLSSSVPSDAAVEAAKAAGWEVTLYDE